MAALLHLIFGLEKFLLLALPVGLHGLDLRVHLVLLGLRLLDQRLCLRWVELLLLSLPGLSEHL